MSNKECIKAASTVAIINIYVLIPYILGMGYSLLFSDAFNLSKLYIHGEFFLYSVSLLSSIVVGSQSENSSIKFKFNISTIIMILCGGLYSLVAYTPETPNISSMFWISTILYLFSNIMLFQHTKDKLKEASKINYIGEEFAEKRAGAEQNLSQKLS